MPRSSSSISRVPLVLSLAGNVLPLFPLQPALGACLHEIRRRHPQIFDRLGSYAMKVYWLDPTDLPFSFVLQPSPSDPRVFAARSIPQHVDVRIAGPFAALIGLVDGSCDGDALFFSRDIQVEGDMEAAVALRNAIDDSGINIVAESVAWLGPLSPLAERLVRRMVAEPLRPYRQDIAGNGG